MPPPSLLLLPLQLLEIHSRVLLPMVLLLRPLLVLLTLLLLLYVLVLLMLMLLLMCLQSSVAPPQGGVEPGVP
jgi:hypothetical protein